MRGAAVCCARVALSPKRRAPPTYRQRHPNPPSLRSGAGLGEEALTNLATWDFGPGGWDALEPNFHPSALARGCPRGECHEGDLGVSIALLRLFASRIPDLADAVRVASGEVEGSGRLRLNFKFAPAFEAMPPGAGATLRARA